MTTDDLHEGGCRCGRTRYAARGTPFHATACHCADCRRSHAAPWVGWFSLPAAGFRWTGDAPARHASSPGATRSFCAACGTPLLFESARFPEEVDIATASLDDLARVPPADHVWVSQALPWALAEDGLPRHARSRGEG